MVKQGKQQAKTRSYEIVLKNSIFTIHFSPDFTFLISIFMYLKDRVLEKRAQGNRGRLRCCFCTPTAVTAVPAQSPHSITATHSPMWVINWAASSLVTLKGVSVANSEAEIQPSMPVWDGGTKQELNPHALTPNF